MADLITQANIAPLANSRADASDLRLGGFSILVFSLASVGLVSSGLLPFSTLTGLFPGANLPMMITIGMGICLLLGYTYSVIGSIIRRNGADYFLVSRVISPGLAFGISWAMVFFNAIFIGFILAKTGQVTMLVFLRSIALIAKAPGMLITADFFASPQGVSISGSVAICLAFVLSILSPKANIRFMQVGFFLLIISWGIILAMLFFPMGGFQASWDSYMGAGNFASQLTNAHSAGMQLDTGPKPLFLGGLLAAVWIFYGFQAPAYIAGEIKQNGRSLLAGVLGAVVIAWLGIAGAAFLLQRIISPEWISAQSFLALGGQSSLPWLSFYATISHPDPLLVSIFSLVGIISLLNMAQAFMCFTSRIIQSWAVDDLLPSSTGFIHPQLKSPIIAILIVSIIAQFGVWIVADGGGTISVSLMFVFVMILIQIMPILAVVLAPFTRKTWFSSAGSMANMRIGPLPLVSLTGFLSLFFFIGFMVIGLTTSILARPVIDALLFFVISVATGLIYFGLRSRGIRESHDRFHLFPPPAE